MAIHPTACIDPEAQIAPGVDIGPYCVIYPGVKIGTGTKLYDHVTIFGHTSIGCGNVIYPYVVLGGEPQDVKYRGGPTRLRIGDNNVIREFVTMNRGTELGGGETIVGNNNYFMACSHVAHDCIIGDHVILSNTAILGGHVQIDDYAILSGQVCVHHYVTIGQISYVGGGSAVSQDVPPYMIAQGVHAKIRSVNSVGLQRRNFTPEVIMALKEAYRIIWRSGIPRSEAIAMVQQRNGQYEEVRVLVDFLRRTAAGKQGRAREALRHVLT
jgi:UDP-N-acetylglucosamine acyltransferase